MRALLFILVLLAASPALAQWHGEGHGGWHGGGDWHGGGWRHEGWNGGIYGVVPVPLPEVVPAPYYGGSYSACYERWSHRWRRMVRVCPEE
jgi:hypothetical protein